MTDEVPKKKTVSVTFHCALFSLFDISTLEAMTDRLSQNISMELSFYTAQYVSRVQPSHDLVMWVLVWLRTVPVQSNLVCHSPIRCFIHIL